jgi:phage shock protein PspC (stress-responsive transcriptional regulator)
MDGTEVRGTLREMWETRPARPRDDRKVAGVAAAIGRRYDVDPVLIRIGFVVAAFGGVGVPLYLAGWLALPSDGAPDGRRRPHVVFGLAILAFLSFGWAFSDDGPGFGGGGILVALVAFGLLFLLHRSRADRPAVAPGAPGAAAEPGTVSLVKGSPVDGGQPPSWDPLGAEPFAWDLPEPAAAPAPPAVKGPPVTAVTLAAALLAGGTTALLQLATGTFTAAGVPVLLGVVLAVLGAGLVAGSFLHAGRGLVAAAVVVGLLTWGSLASPFDDLPRGGDGDLRAAPRTVAQVQPRYEQRFGDVELDLSRLDLGTGGAAVRTMVDLGAGDVQVIVSDDADVVFTGSTGAGSVTFGDEERSGPNARLDAVRDLGEDGVASGRPLEITVRAGVGDVEVSRG